MVPGVCGNGHKELSEQCDAGSNGACPTGVCDPDCTCEDPVCGNDVLEDGEQCDTGETAVCPTAVCDPDCTCADPVCGNNVQEEGEICDGTSATLCAGTCRSPGSSQECTCPFPDECLDARPIGAFPYSDYSLNTANATVGIDDPIDCSRQHTVWYTFTAPASGVVTASAVGSGYRTLLVAWHGTCGDFRRAGDGVSCSSGVEPKVSFTVAAGRSYHLEISSFEEGGPLAFTATFEQAPCGNGMIDTGEECDGDNAGSCTTSRCNYDCTCGCTDIPAPDCKAPAAAGTSRLKITDSADDPRDQLRWIWRPGTSTTHEDLGDPIYADVYQLCVYDADSLVSNIKAGSKEFCRGGFCWTQRRDSFRYADKDQAGDGATLIKLKSGADGEASIDFKAAGENLETPLLGSQLTGPLLVQLQRSSSSASVCWESVFSPPFRRNDDSRFADNAD